MSRQQSRTRKSGDPHGFRRVQELDKTFFGNGHRPSTVSKDFQPPPVGPFPVCPGFPRSHADNFAADNHLIALHIGSHSIILRLP